MPTARSSNTPAELAVIVEKKEEWKGATKWQHSPVVRLATCWSCKSLDHDHRAAGHARTAVGQDVRARIRNHLSPRRDGADIL